MPLRRISLPDRRQVQYRLFGNLELLVCDLAIAITISITDQLIHPYVGEFLTKAVTDMAQLCGYDEAIAVAIVDLERFNELLFDLRHSPIRDGSFLDLPSIISVN